uniref:fimbrial protein n=1 Tax=Segatella copri TaxID=165179 RepID=UPI0025CF33BE
MRRFHIYIGFIVWLLTSLFAVSCTDELEGNGYTPNSSSNLHVLVPTVLSANGTRTDDASGLPTYNATVDECQINDLTLYAFPTGNEGKLLVETLPAPLATMMVEPHVANYQLNIEPGTYHIYVVANMNKVLSGKTFKTEDELKNKVLSYGVGTEPGMPVSTNIPMIYEPKDVNGNIINTKIEKSGDKYTEVAANLKFTCVKVKLNLIFDPTAEGSAFNGNSYIIKDILAQKLSPSTTLSWDGAFSKPASSVSQDYANGFENEVYATSSEASNKGGYYKAEDWTEDATNANVNNKDIITLVQGATPKAAPQNAADKWLFQGTYYLPERYIAEASQQSTLKVNGSVNGNIENYYKIKLGHRQDESSTSKEVPTFPRGTYYEIIGKIKSLGNMTLNCNVSVKDWTPVTIEADFNHTTLWVSKAEASVTSTTADSIDYKSNVMLTEADFGCDEKVGEKDVIVTKLDAVKQRITFNINKDIKFSEYNGKYKGTAKVWIKAGNIKKYLDVAYDASPYFEVNPQEVTIYWNSDNNTKVVQFKTNLGGLVFTKDVTSSTVGKSTIQASCDNHDTPEGTFKIVATTDPVTTTVHYLTVQPKESAEGIDFVKKIKVTVKPAVGNYRINFRAINDRAYYKGGNGTDNYEGTLEEKMVKTYNGETGNTNWADGWYDYSQNKDDRVCIPNPDYHYTYVYTQIGETTGNEVNSPVWEFSGKWPGDKMVADNTNVGWYYKDFPKEAKPQRTVNVNSNEEKERLIKPGETLVMFSNNTNNDQGYSLHRCPHHLEPGIPLFDYEDREGWIVYDPTSDPTWHIYDDMPTIENIKFTIYTKFQTYGWFKDYGIAQLKNNSSEREQFTIFDKNNKSWTCTNLNNGWYKTVITLKAVKGDHEKDIRIMTANEISDEKSILLFNGNSYEKHNNDTGYYYDGSWYAGKPSGVN